ncbi:MAG: hypothetical protein JHC94_10100, partial [Acidimicrobiia bacterium]|nr:hypothetical protein [Acidimicrobiia bacterium]
MTAAPITSETTTPRNKVHGFLLSLTGGAPVYPLVILTGLLAVDELDRV